MIEFQGRIHYWYPRLMSVTSRKPSTPFLRVLPSSPFHQILKGQQREIFWSRFFTWIYSIWAPDFDTKRIFFSLLFSQSYSNVFIYPRCRLLQGFKISAVAYCAYYHSSMQPTALMYDIIFPYKSTMQVTATIQNQRCSLLRLLKNPYCSLQRLLKNPHCSLQRLLTITAVAYSGDSMATVRIQMSNFE